jgi:hypothetical protein
LGLGGDQTQEGFNNKYTLPQHNNTDVPHMLFLALLCPKMLYIFILENEVQQFQI